MCSYSVEIIVCVSACVDRAFAVGGKIWNWFSLILGRKSFPSCKLWVREFCYKSSWLRTEHGASFTENIQYCNICSIVFYEVKLPCYKGLVWKDLMQTNQWKEANSIFEQKYRVWPTRNNEYMKLVQKRCSKWTFLVLNLLFPRIISKRISDGLHLYSRPFRIIQHNITLESLYKYRTVSIHCIFSFIPTTSSTWQNYNFRSIFDFTTSAGSSLLNIRTLRGSTNITMTSAAYEVLYLVNSERKNRGIEPSSPQ